MSRMIARRSLFLLCVLGLFLSAQRSIAIDPAVPVLPYAQSAVLFASDGVMGAQFGHAIVAQENFAAISAPRQDVQDSINIGEVYLFERGPNGWEENGRLSHPPGAQTDWFGGVLALDGDYLAVSTSIASLPRTGSQLGDAVVVYQRVGDEWQLQSEPILPDKDYSGSFRYALALDGTTLAISASGVSADENGVFIFTHTGQTWTQEAWLAAPAGVADWYPSALALRGDVLLVGSPDANGHGLVTIYRRTGNTWSPDGQLLPEASETYGFGSAVDFDGDTAVVASCSAAAHDADNYLNLYTTDGNSWTPTVTLPLDAITNEFQCDSVTLEGQHLVVSALKWADPQDSGFMGGAFLFRQDQGQWTLQQFLSHSAVLPDDAFGSAATLAGDEVLISALMQYRLNAAYRGAVHIFSPRPAGSGTAFLPIVARGELMQTEGLIVFEGLWMSESYDLYLSTADGRGRTRLTHSPDNDIQPDWSPDGRSLVYVQQANGSQKLVTMDIASRQQTDILLPNEMNPTEPRWSPDGQRIAFVNNRIDRTDIYLVDLDGNTLTNVTRTPKFVEAMPAWSPDGTRLVYQTNQELWIMDVESRESRLLVGVENSPESPDWSPDGNFIAYTGWSSGGHGLSVIPANGGDSVPILDEAFNSRWSPDGKSIVFNGTLGGLFRVYLDNGRIAEIVPNRNFARPVEQP